MECSVNLGAQVEHTGLCGFGLESKSGWLISLPNDSTCFPLSHPSVGMHQSKRIQLPSMPSGKGQVATQREFSLEGGGRSRVPFAEQ